MYINTFLNIYYNIVIMCKKGYFYMDKYRIKITKFLQWNDRNGCYTNENCDLEEVPRMTY